MVMVCSVQEMERIKQLIVEKEVEEKNSRIEKLKIKREQEIMDCKAQAQYTADLRDQLRFCNSIHIAIDNIILNSDRMF